MKGALLAAAQALYLAVNAARRMLYRRGLLRARRLPRPVVSIGNISAGGAGKTPAVIALAEALTRRGARVAVLTRGYGRKGSGGVVKELDPERYGDEPVLIKKHLHNVDVIVGSNRYESAVDYLSDHSCDLFILDDGFQHLQLARDLDIVIDVPAARFHREGRFALRRASLVIPRRLHLTIPESTRGRRVLAFAGLADPAQFFEALRSAGMAVAASLSFPDHHRYTAADLRRIDQAAAAAGAEVIVTTEKDAVKLVRTDIVAVPAEFELDHDVIERAAALIGR